MSAILDTVFQTEMEELEGNPSYFIKAIGYDNSRHYSAPIVDYQKAMETYEIYKDMIKNLSRGGYVIFYFDDKYIQSDWVI